MTPSDYEQQYYDVLDDLEQAAKQSEEEERITLLAEQVIHDAEDKGWHLRRELEAEPGSFEILMKIIYREYPQYSRWRPTRERPKITEQELMHYFNKLQS